MFPFLPVQPLAQRPLQTEDAAFLDFIIGGR